MPEEPLITANNQVVKFTCGIWLDVDTFNSHLEADDLTTLETAVALHKGDFLNGFYNDWIINERYHLYSRYLEAFRLLIEAYEKASHHRYALDTALLLLEQDPLQESAMRSYARLGCHHDALEQTNALEKLSGGSWISNRCRRRLA